MVMEFGIQLGIARHMILCVLHGLHELCCLMIVANIAIMGINQEELNKNEHILNLVVVFIIVLMSILDTFHIKYAGKRTSLCSCSIYLSIFTISQGFITSINFFFCIQSLIPLAALWYYHHHICFTLFTGGFFGRGKERVFFEWPLTWEANYLF